MKEVFCIGEKQINFKSLIYKNLLGVYLPAGNLWNLKNTRIRNFYDLS